jgi:hypothetical protein
MDNTKITLDCNQEQKYKFIKGENVKNTSIYSYQI